MKIATTPVLSKFLNKIKGWVDFKSDHCPTSYTYNGETTYFSITYIKLFGWQIAFSLISFSTAAVAGAVITYAHPFVNPEGGPYARAMLIHVGDNRTTSVASPRSRAVHSWTTRPPYGNTVAVINVGAASDITQEFFFAIGKASDW